MDYRKNYQSWLSDPRLSEEGKRELEEIARDEKAKEESLNSVRRACAALSVTA